MKNNPTSDQDDALHSFIDVARRLGTVQSISPSTHVEGEANTNSTVALVIVNLGKFRTEWRIFPEGEVRLDGCEVLDSNLDIKTAESLMAAFRRASR